MDDSSGTPSASRQQSIDALSTPIDTLAIISWNEEVFEVLRQRLASPIKRTHRW
jgi:hypothetical protein